ASDGSRLAWRSWRCCIPVFTLIPLALVFVNCAQHPRQTARTVEQKPFPMEGVLWCRAWDDSCERCAGVVDEKDQSPQAIEVGVVVHVMIATTVDPADREREYEKPFSDRRKWAIAPVTGAVKSRVRMEVKPGGGETWIDYWTPRMIGAFFGRNGRVNEIWGRYGIELRLVSIEDCQYDPKVLRPDGLSRDSIPIPESSTPGRTHLFRGITRLFTQEAPNVLHVFLWWSVSEGDIDDADAVTLTEAADTAVWGYSRSASRGGPAMWIGAWRCLTPEEGIDHERRCGKAVAHEVGHALGLQHVETPRENLMYIAPVAGGYKE